MGVSRQNDGTNAIKLLVVSSNQICLNALDFLAGQLKETCVVTSSSRINHNGGYLMHFDKKLGLESSLASVEATVAQHDDQAKTVIYNCPEAFSG